MVSKERMHFCPLRREEMRFMRNAMSPLAVFNRVVAIVRR